jgi:hypothetical protein
MDPQDQGVRLDGRVNLGRVDLTKPAATNTVTGGQSA